MAKKQTRRSISVSRGTYERLKAYCETNQISMSQFVERRVGDFLGRAGVPAQPIHQSAPAQAAPRPVPAAPAPASAPVPTPAIQQERTVPTDAFEVSRPAAAAPARMSSINQPISQPVDAPRSAPKPTSDEPLLKDPDAKLTADQIFTF